MNTSVIVKSHLKRLQHTFGSLTLSHTASSEIIAQNCGQNTASDAFMNHRGSPDNDFDVLASHTITLRNRWRCLPNNNGVKLSRLSRNKTKCDMNGFFGASSGEYSQSRSCRFQQDLIPTSTEAMTRWTIVAINEASVKYPFVYRGCTFSGNIRSAFFLLSYLTNLRYFRPSISRRLSYFFLAEFIN